MLRLATRYALALLIAAGWATSEAAGQSASPSAGLPAPEVKPSQWLNHDGPVDWQRLGGRLILVEKWATW